MPLNKFQEDFKDYMLASPATRGDSEALFEGVFQTGSIPVAERLDVYRNNILVSLTDIILAVFPAIKKLVGEEFLKAAATQFVQAYPPRQGYLNLYGTGFDTFLEDYEPAKDLAYLPDMARLEIAYNNAYHAGDDQALSADALSAIAPDDLFSSVIALRHSVQLISSPFPIARIREFALNDSDENQETLDISLGGVQLLIYRQALEVRALTLTDDSFAMMSALADGKPLGEALEDTLAQYPGFDIQQFIQTQFELETFCSIHPK